MDRTEQRALAWAQDTRQLLDSMRCADVRRELRAELRGMHQIADALEHTELAAAIDALYTQPDKAPAGDRNE